MLLIYTEKLSPRFSYIVHHIFENMMGVSIGITTDLEAFIKSDGYKISYGKNPIGNEFFIKNFGLLFEKGIDNVEIYINYWEEMPCFFCAKKGDIPFDIFSASFYLLSRYEEYLPHVRDAEGNFSASESLAYRYRFLEIPLVDMWVENFKRLLVEKFPDIIFTSKKYHQASVIEVGKAFKYKHKGFLRSAFRILINSCTFQWKEVVENMRVLTNLQKDPYDFYNELIHFHKQKEITNIFFFLLTNYTAYDQGLSYNNPKYKDLIKYMADYSIVSVLASYDSVLSTKKLKEERQRMVNIINRPVRRFRAGHNHISVPDVYRRISEAEYNEDYTMGYLSHIGFRASTCTPFCFYDIGLEVQMPILVNSFCFHSRVLQRISAKEVLSKLRTLKAKVQELSGEFVTIFTNGFLGKSRTQAEFEFYKKIMNL